MMQNQNYITANEFCIKNDIEISFIYSLRENGLIDITTIDETDFIPPGQIPQIEKISRLHNDLGINIEGIETITYLLERLDEMQHQITFLQNRLRFYE